MRAITWKWVLAVLILGVSWSHAIEKKPLPDFPVTSAQGHLFSSLQLAGRSRWLLVVVSPSDPLCNRLLTTFAQWPESRWLARTTFIVEAPAQDAQDYLTKQLPNQWQRVTWVSDEPLNAGKALNLQGLPVVIGMDQMDMPWTISGVLNDPSTLESIVQSWLR